jgi:hypothetical protein
MTRPHVLLTFEMLVPPSNSQDFRCSVMDKDADQELMMRLLFLNRTGEEDVGA